MINANNAEVKINPNSNLRIGMLKMFCLQTCQKLCKIKKRKFKYFLKVNYNFQDSQLAMKSHFNLTINELPKTKKMQIDQRHPLLRVQQNKFALDQQERITQIGAIYGSAMSMMVKHQRSVLAEPERMPGLRSSFLSLESYLGRLSTLQFQDVINRDGLMKGPNAHDLYIRQFS